MITQLSLKNFRSVRDATIELTPLNVFVGANNSGKSTTLLALSFLRQLVIESDVRRACTAIGVTPETLIARGQSSCRLSIAGAFMGSEIRYTIEFDSNGVGTDKMTANSPPLTIARNENPSFPRYSLPNGAGLYGGLGDFLPVVRHGQVSHPAAQAFCQFVASMAVYDLSVPVLKRESKIVVNPTLSRTGDNLASVLDWLRDHHPDAFDFVQAQVQNAARDIKSVIVPTVAEGTKVLGLQHKDGQIYTAPVLSDGLVMFVALAVAAAASRLTPTLIAIEEPERGVHPRRLHEILDAFRRVSNGGLQIILTTHSPIVLDAFHDDPESVFVFDRIESGTTITRLSEKPEATDLKDAALGQAWYAGLLDGLPPQ